MANVKGIAGAVLAVAFVGAIAAGGTSGAPSDDASSTAVQQSSTAASSSRSSGTSADTASSSSVASASSSNATTTTSTLPEGSTFSITFLDVGQGDAAILNCDGHYMIIDGGPPDASRLMYTYCRDNNITHADYLVATHQDSDHTGGISGALQLVTVDRAFCSRTEGDGRAFQSMVRYLGNQGVSIEVPYAGETFDLGSAQVHVIAAGGSSQNDSIILRVVYGNTSFLFTGDAPEEEELIAVGSGMILDSDLIKVAHHGSAGSSSLRFMNAVSPQFAVISVGKDNGYGHPTEEALARITGVGATVYRTDLQGDIVVTSDGNTISIAVEKNADANTTISKVEAQKQELVGISYIGNVKSHKFHRTTCKSLPKEQNRIAFDSRDDAINAGYSPCGNCNP